MGVRDRHGRGLRSPVFPPGHRGRRGARERFDATVGAYVGELERRWGREWGRLEFAVEEVPPSGPTSWERGVPLGRLFPAEGKFPARIVLYRKPIEQRAFDGDDQAALVRDVLVDNLAHLLGRAPEDVDPSYGT